MSIHEVSLQLFITALRLEPPVPVLLFCTVAVAVSITVGVVL